LLRIIFAVIIAVGGGVSGLAAAPIAAACPAGTYQGSSGDCVQDPTAAPSPPPGATALCRDGTYSFSETRSGTCSRHGGVKQWLTS
jgi:hypothetical protein